jgi:dCMP deaminase
MKQQKQELESRWLSTELQILECKRNEKIVQNSKQDLVRIQKPPKDLKFKRPGWDEYFLNLCSNGINARSTCDRGKVGCVITKDNRILVTGYAGAPPGLPHCDEVGHMMAKTVWPDKSVSEHCIRTLHAEQNAIVQAARFGIALDGSTLYCTMTPCRTCAMIIISVGIKKVVCQKKYHKAKESIQMFRKAKVKLIHKENKVQTYGKKPT